VYPPFNGLTNVTGDPHLDVGAAEREDGGPRVPFAFAFESTTVAAFTAVTIPPVLR
jgi:hypothetical protein